MDGIYLLLGISLLGFVILLSIEHKKTQTSFYTILKKLYSLDTFFPLTKKRIPPFSLLKIKKILLSYYDRDYTQGLRLSVRKILLDSQKTSSREKKESSLKKIKDITTE